MLSPHLLPRHYSGPPLTADEWGILKHLELHGACRMQDHPSTTLSTLLQRGVLFLRPSVVGPIVSLGYSACDLLGMDSKLLPSADVAANLVYFEEALALAVDQGYKVTTIEVTGRAILKPGIRRHLLLARASRNGYGKETIRAQLRRKGAISTREGTVVLVVPDAAPYARLLDHHPQLRVWTHALQPPPTTARTAPPRPGTSARSGPP